MVYVKRLPVPGAFNRHVVAAARLFIRIVFVIDWVVCPESWLRDPENLSPALPRG